MSNRNTVQMSIAGRWVTLPAAEIEGMTIAVRGKWLRIAVVVDEELQERTVEDPDKFLQQLKRGAFQQSPDLFTFSQCLSDRAPKYSYPLEMESVAAVQISTYQGWWEKLPQEGRKNVRRAEKRGVVTSMRNLDDQLIHGIVSLNNDSPMRQGKPFVHYGKSFEQVRHDQTNYLDRSEYVCSYVGEELIGYLKMVYHGEVASLVQILPKASHSDKRPANALLAKAIEACATRGMKYLTYGKFNYGNKADSPLREFKVRNGFEEFLVPRFYAPLTLRGKLCFRMGLHRGLLGILPESLIAAGVQVRTQWYNFLQVKKAGVAQ